MWSYAARPARARLRSMHLIQPSHARRPARWPIVRSLIVGIVLLGGGLGLAWVSIATPLVRGLTPVVLRPAPEQLVLGGLVWAVSLVAPACFAFVGIVRLYLLVGAVVTRPHLGVVKRSAIRLGDEYVVAAAIRLPEGRRIRNVIVGPFGIAHLHEPPPLAVTRRKGNAWEAQAVDGRWVPLENPLDRAVRDAEQIRRWMAADDRDFVVKVYPAVVTADKTVVRSPGCAVISEREIGAWLASLPPQRSLNSNRRADLVETIRSVA